VVPVEKNGSEPQRDRAGTWRPSPPRRSPRAYSGKSSAQTAEVRRVVRASTALILGLFGCWPDPTGPTQGTAMMRPTRVSSTGRRSQSAGDHPRRWRPAGTFGCHGLNAVPTCESAGQRRALCMWLSSEWFVSPPARWAG